MLPTCYMDAHARHATPSFETALTSCLTSFSQNTVLRMFNECTFTRLCFKPQYIPLSSELWLCVQLRQWCSFPCKPLWHFLYCAAFWVPKQCGCRLSVNKIFFDTFYWSLASWKSGFNTCISPKLQHRLIFISNLNTEFRYDSEIRVTQWACTKAVEAEWQGGS